MESHVIHKASCSRCGECELVVISAPGHHYETVRDHHGHTGEVRTICGHTKNTLDRFFDRISGLFARR